MRIPRSPLSRLGSQRPAAIDEVSHSWANVTVEQMERTPRSPRSPESQPDSHNYERFALEVQIVDSGDMGKTKRSQSLPSAEKPKQRRRQAPQSRHDREIEVVLGRSPPSEKDTKNRSTKKNSPSSSKASRRSSETTSEAFERSSGRQGPPAPPPAPSQSLKMKPTNRASTRAAPSVEQGPVTLTGTATLGSSRSAASKAVPETTEKRTKSADTGKRTAHRSVKRSETTNLGKNRALATSSETNSSTKKEEDGKKVGTSDLLNRAKEGSTPEANENGKATADLVPETFPETKEPFVQKHDEAAPIKRNMPKIKGMAAEKGTIPVATNARRRAIAEEKPVEVVSEDDPIVINPAETKSQQLLERRVDENSIRNMIKEEFLDECAPLTRKKNFLGGFFRRRHKKRFKPENTVAAIDEEEEVSPEVLEKEFVSLLQVSRDSRDPSVDEIPIPERMGLGSAGSFASATSRDGFELDLRGAILPSRRDRRSSPAARRESQGVRTTSSSKSSSPESVKPTTPDSEQTLEKRTNPAEEKVDSEAKESTETMKAKDEAASRIHASPNNETDIKNNSSPGAQHGFAINDSLSALTLDNTMSHSKEEDKRKHSSTAPRRPSLASMTQHLLQVPLQRRKKRASIWKYLFPGSRDSCSESGNPRFLSAALASASESSNAHGSVLAGYMSPVPASPVARIEEELRSFGADLPPEKITAEGDRDTSSAKAIVPASSFTKLSYKTDVENEGKDGNEKSKQVDTNPEEDNSKTSTVLMNQEENSAVESIADIVHRSESVDTTQGTGESLLSGSTADTKNKTLLKSVKPAKWLLAAFGFKAASATLSADAATDEETHESSLLSSDTQTQTDGDTTASPIAKEAALSSQPSITDLLFVEKKTDKDAPTELGSASKEDAPQELGSPTKEAAPQESSSKEDASQELGRTIADGSEYSKVDPCTSNLNDPTLKKVTAEREAELRSRSVERTASLELKPNSSSKDSTTLNSKELKAQDLSCSAKAEASESKKCPVESSAPKQAIEKPAAPQGADAVPRPNLAELSIMQKQHAECASLATPVQKSTVSEIPTNRCQSPLVYATTSTVPERSTATLVEAYLFKQEAAKDNSELMKLATPQLQPIQLSQRKFSFRKTRSLVSAKKQRYLGNTPKPGDEHSIAQVHSMPATGPFNLTASRLETIVPVMRSKSSISEEAIMDFDTSTRADDEQDLTVRVVEQNNEALEPCSEAKNAEETLLATSAHALVEGEDDGDKAPETGMQRLDVTFVSQPSYSPSEPMNNRKSSIRQGRLIPLIPRSSSTLTAKSVNSTKSATTAKTTPTRRCRKPIALGKVRSLPADRMHSLTSSKKNLSKEKGSSSPATTTHQEKLKSSSDSLSMDETSRRSRNVAANLDAETLETNLSHCVNNNTNDNDWAVGFVSAQSLRNDSRDSRDSQCLSTKSPEPSPRSGDSRDSEHSSIKSSDSRVLQYSPDAPSDQSAEAKSEHVGEFAGQRNVDEAPIARKESHGSVETKMSQFTASSRVAALVEALKRTESVDNTIVKDASQESSKSMNSQSQRSKSTPIRTTPEVNKIKSTHSETSIIENNSHQSIRSTSNQLHSLGESATDLAEADLAEADLAEADLAKEIIESKPSSMEAPIVKIPSQQKDEESSQLTTPDEADSDAKDGFKQAGEQKTALGSERSTHATIQAKPSNDSKKSRRANLSKAISKISSRSRASSTTSNCSSSKADQPSSEPKANTASDTTASDNRQLYDPQFDISMLDFCCEYPKRLLIDEGCQSKY